MSERIYVYASKNSFLLNHAVDEKLKTIQVDPFNIMRYDLTESLVDDILEDLQTISFFAEEKVIIISHFEVLKDMSQSMIDDMIKYIEKPNPDVVLIIKIDDMIPSTHPLGKAILDHTFIEEIKDLPKQAYVNFVTDRFKEKGFTISLDAANELLARINEDFHLLEQEIEKLTLYHINSKTIDIEDVMVLTSKNLEENIYELTNALIQKNHTKMIEIYADLMMRNEDPLRIINNIASKLRELVHTKLLLDQGYTQAQIAEHFNIKSGRAYYLVKDAQSMVIKVLEKHLEQLSELDYQIKSGKKDKKLGLEFYLLGV
ncbi:MAG: DNA polymerase III subunit delta [Acholeplasmataceae bacterium]